MNSFNAKDKKNLAVKQIYMVEIKVDGLVHLGSLSQGPSSEFRDS